MLSPTDRAALLDLCQKFIHSGDDINLAHLLDLVNATILDQHSQDWKDWSLYMEKLNEAWVLIHKENQYMPWPEPPPPGFTPPSINPTTVVNLTEAWADTFKGSRPTQEYRKKLRMERKLRLEGGNGVGPARLPTQSSERQDERRKGAGRPADSLIDDLIIQVDMNEGKDGLEKKIVRWCIGCDKEAAGRDAGRIRAHAQQCSDLAVDFPTLFKKVTENLAGRAHSSKLERSESLTPRLSSSQSQASLKSKAREQSTETSTGQESMLSYMNPARISKQHKIQIESFLFQMFICCALPWALMDSPFFCRFVQALAPNFVIPDRSFFFTTHLAQEVAAWSIKFQEFLKSKAHLTLSLDGWSTRARDEIYTFHTTTPERRSFFTDSHVFKGISVTGDALKQVILRLLELYGATRYSAIAGDGGPNVRSAKIKICAEYPWILNVYDPCHNLNLFMKDLGKLYKEMLATVSGIANYFGQSNYGTFHLDAQRKIDGVREGIKSNSDTRFSSSYQQVVSVNTCISSIKKCLDQSTLKFTTAATKKLLPFITEGPRHYKFMSDMSAFIRLLSSGANAILTLEGQNSTCADIFYAWVCIAYHLEHVLASPTIGISHLRADVIRIYNHRFNQMMTESSHSVFLLAYYLHPLFRSHGGLQLTMPTLTEDQQIWLDQYPALFVTLLKAALNIFRGEQLRLKDSGQEVVPEFIRQFKLYADNKEPFCTHVWNRNTKPLQWWEAVSRDSNAHLVAKVAIKIFSISPSEICDERTASRLGWFNAARRSSMTPENLVTSAKLYDYYVNGFTDGDFAHTARVHLSEVTPSPSTSTTPTVHSAPSLMDLLNTQNIEPHDAGVTALEDMWFNNPDPYDLAETERADEVLQETEEILTARSSTRFDIGNLVKLSSDELKSLIMDVDYLGPGASLTPHSSILQAQVVGKPGEWSVDSYF